MQIHNIFLCNLHICIFQHSDLIWHLSREQVTKSQPVSKTFAYFRQAEEEDPSPQFRVHSIESLLPGMLIDFPYQTLIRRHELSVNLRAVHCSIRPYCSMETFSIL